MYTILQKTGLQHKKWATLPCNHPLLDPSMLVDLHLDYGWMHGMVAHFR
jgi:hypothetical protein